MFWGIAQPVQYLSQTSIALESGKSSLLPPQNASLTEGTLTHTISKQGELFIIMRLPVVYQKVLRRGVFFSTSAA